MNDCPENPHCEEFHKLRADIKQLEKQLEIAKNALMSLNYDENPYRLIVESALELLE